MRPGDRVAADRREAVGLVSQLLQLLAGGPLRSADVFAAAAARGMPRAIIRRAAHQLGVEFLKQGPGGTWVWALPGAPPAPIEDLSTPHPEKVEKLES